MVEYFLLTWNDAPGPGVSAFPENGVGAAQDLAAKLLNVSELPFDLTLVKLTPYSDGLSESSDLSGLRDIWPDYLPNQFAWPFCSVKLRKVIDRHLLHDEDLHWISATVSGAGETREYYVARFDTLHDVLDGEKTLAVPETGHIIRPWFSNEKIQELSIFPLPAEYDLWRITSSLYINRILKESIESENISGTMFEPARHS